MHRLVLCVALAACIDERTVQLPDLPEQHRVMLLDIPQFSPRPVDVLLLIDNASPMRAYEERVAANLPALAFLLDGAAWWDVHLGVVTSDLGCPGGAAWRYGELVGAPFVIHWKHLDRTTTRNYTGELADQLAALAAVGHRGCGLHRPLDTIAQALRDPPVGFRRDDADLLVVVIGASDDASKTSIEEAVERLAPSGDGSLRGLIAIYPEGAPRLDALFEAVTRRGIGSVAARSPIEHASFDAFSTWWGHGGWWGSPCIEGMLLDREIDQDGVQPSCSASDVVRLRSGELVHERVLPACTGENRPCWRIVEDRMNCPATSFGPHSLAFEIDRTDFPPRGTHTLVNCLTEAP